MNVNIILHPYEILEIGNDADEWHGRIKEYGSHVILAEADGVDLQNVLNNLREKSDETQIAYWNDLSGQVKECDER